MYMYFILHNKDNDGFDKGVVNPVPNVEGGPSFTHVKDFFEPHVAAALKAAFVSNPINDSFE